MRHRYDARVPAITVHRDVIGGAIRNIRSEGRLAISGDEPSMRWEVLPIVCLDLTLRTSVRLIMCPINYSTKTWTGVQLVNETIERRRHSCKNREVHNKSVRLLVTRYLQHTRIRTVQVPSELPCL